MDRRAWTKVSALLTAQISGAAALALNIVDQFWIGTAILVAGTALSLWILRKGEQA